MAFDTSDRLALVYSATTLRWLDGLLCVAVSELEIL